MWLKSLFIGIYPAVAMVAGVYSLMQLAEGQAPLAWSGSALTWWPFLFLLAWLMIGRRTARTSTNLPVILALAALGLVLAMLSFVRNDPDAHLAAVLAALGLICFLLYNFWYSRFENRDSGRLALGQAFPDIAFEDAQGNSVRTADLTGSPVLFLFYRGNWCPLCMAQIKEIAAQYRELAARGLKIALISPQPHGNTARLAARFDVPFTFLVDPGNRVADTLGIAAPGGLPLGLQALGYDSDTVLPTVVITDPSGRIVFLDQTDNYRIRPEPATFLAVMDQIAAR